MAIGGGTITLRNIITEWSEGIGGTQNLSSFYRNTSNENAFCPNNYNTITTLPTSGNLSASSFRNTEAEANGVTIMGGWYQAQSSFFTRTGFRGGNTAPPIDDMNGGTYNRFNSTWQTVYAFDQGGSATFHRAYSKKSTLLQWVIGAQSQITMGSVMDGTYTQHQAVNFREMNFRIGWNDNLHRTTTSSYINYNRLGNNSGAWDGQYVLPGLWSSGVWITQPVQGTGGGATSYTYTIPAGEIMFFTAYSSGIDGNIAATHYPPTVGSGIGYYRSCHWWYNSCVQQMYFNTSSSPQNVTWPNAWTAGDGKTAAGPNGMFAGNDSANGHQIFTLTRVY
jgi:hypothetical protein